ncbi:hypothetical protein V2J09_007568 [Rumex salicifolius]
MQESPADIFSIFFDEIGIKERMEIHRTVTVQRQIIYAILFSSSLSPGHTPVYLNVYDLTPMNGYLYWAGLGIFHSGVEVHGVEYAFGAHDFPTSGVFEVEPRECPGFKFRKSIFIGTTDLDAKKVREFMEQHASGYNGDSYHLIVKNCNHFCMDVCHSLTGKKIPKWVNRLAKIGSSCNCILPETLKVTTVQQDGSLVTYKNSEKKRLKNSFSCLSSISMRHKQLSVSSLFFRSPLKCSLSSCKAERSESKALTES